MKISTLHLATEFVIFVVLLDQILVYTCTGLIAGTQYKVPGTMITNPNQFMTNTIQMHLDLQKE